MRFLDYNGSGSLDPQDIATSVVVEESVRVDEQDPEPGPDYKPTQLDSNAGCATMAALVAFTVLITLVVL